MNKIYREVRLILQRTAEAYEHETSRDQTSKAESRLLFAGLGRTAEARLPPAPCADQSGRR